MAAARPAPNAVVWTRYNGDGGFKVHKIRRPLNQRISVPRRPGPGIVQKSLQASSPIEELTNELGRP